MNLTWSWKVRLYAPSGKYRTVVVQTGKTLDEIDSIQNFYEKLTGCKMIIESMSEIGDIEYAKMTPLSEGFLATFAERGGEPSA